MNEYHPTNRVKGFYRLPDAQSLSNRIERGEVLSTVPSWGLPHACLHSPISPVHPEANVIATDCHVLDNRRVVRGVVAITILGL